MPIWQKQLNLKENSNTSRKEHTLDPKNHLFMKEILEIFLVWGTWGMLTRHLLQFSWIENMSM